MIDLKNHLSEELNFAGFCIINMVSSFVIAAFFTLLIWIFDLILTYLGMGDSIPVLIVSNFAEFEGICFVFVFVIVNIIKTITHYTKKEDRKKEEETNRKEEIERK